MLLLKYFVKTEKQTSMQKSVHHSAQKLKRSVEKYFKPKS